MSVWEWLAGVVAVVVPGFGGPDLPVYNGYLEADYVYLAPLTPGRIVSIAGDEGDRVTQGQLLVVLEDSMQVAALRAAEAGVAQAEANLDNLSTGGREAEIAVIRASLRKAEADQALAEATATRTEQLLRQGQVPAARADQDRAALESAVAQVEQLAAQLRVAQLPARDAQRLAAEAALSVAQALAEEARIALAERKLMAPVSGVLDRRFFDAGEVAATGAPILSIFEPERIRAVFFVPEGARSGFGLGDVLRLSCDGCGDGMTARITRMAAEPQYTPPIIYSRDERVRLVFRAEAEVEGAAGLQPGQPVTLWR